VWKSVLSSNPFHLAVVTNSIQANDGMLNRILLIDDNHIQAQRIQSELQRYGLTVEIASTGDMGLATACHRSPGMIIIDNHLLEDNAQLCHMFKSTPATAHIPVILLTHGDEISLKPLDRESGVYDYIRKDTFVEYNLVELLRCLKIL
jgi:CheY-like chemotaxis protein